MISKPQSATATNEPRRRWLTTTGRPHTRAIDAEAVSEHSRHSPGTPSSSTGPRSWKVIPGSATRSFTAGDTSASPGGASAETRADRYGDTGHLAIEQFALAGVQAKADLQAEFAHCFADRRDTATDHDNQPPSGTSRPIPNSEDVRPRTDSTVVRAHQHAAGARHGLPADLAQGHRRMTRIQQAGRARRRWAVLVGQPRAQAARDLGLYNRCRAAEG
jgi:hypothetical protein